MESATKRSLASSKVAPKLMFTLACLYFVQGIPIGLTFYGIPALLRTTGVALEQIAMVQIVGLFWALKCFWSSVVENHWSAKFGKRRSWILPMQLVIVVTIMLLSSVEVSATNLPIIAAILACMSFSGATQDIATDAFAAENSHTESLGVTNTIQMSGVLIGLMVAGPLSTGLFEHLGYQVTCWILAALVLVAMLPITLWRESASKGHVSHSASLKKFFATPNSTPVLVMCSLATINGVIILAIIKFVLIDRGWSLSDVGLVTGIGHLLSMLLGCLFGGIVISYLTFKRALSIGLSGVIGGGLIWFSITQSSELPVHLVWIATFVVGVSMGLVAVAVYTYSMRFSKSSNQPGMNISVFQSTQTFGEIVFSSIATSIAGVLGYGSAFIAGAMIGFACLIALYLCYCYRGFAVNTKQPLSAEPL